MENYKMLEKEQGRPVLAMYRGDSVLMHVNSVGKVVVTKADGEQSYITRNILDNHVILVFPDTVDRFDHDLHQCRVGDVVASSMGWLAIKEIKNSRRYEVCLGKDMWCDFEGKFRNDQAPSVFVDPPKYLLDYIGPKPVITAEGLARQVLSTIIDRSEVVRNEPVNARGSSEVRRKLKEVLGLLANESD